MQIETFQIEMKKYFVEFIEISDENRFIFCRKFHSKILSKTKICQKMQLLWYPIMIIELF